MCYYVIIKSMIWYLIEQSDWAVVGSSRIVSIHSNSTFVSPIVSICDGTRSETWSSCSPCSARAAAFVERWVTMLRGWLLSMCSLFEPRQGRGEGRKLYCYTGNTKVPIRTSNSQRYMKYKWYRDNIVFIGLFNYNLKPLNLEYWSLMLKGTTSFHMFSCSEQGT